ncbi:MAG: hypothetical protein R3C70_07085 [Geminicoccaceae bacterium]
MAVFVGAVPKPVVEQIIRTIGFETWGNAFICCSGSFRVDGALKRTYPALKVHGNDVSLLTCSIGGLLTGNPLNFTFKGPLEFIEEYLDRHHDTPTDRVAAVMVAVELGQLPLNREYGQSRFAYMRDNFDRFHDKARDSLINLLADTRIDAFHTGDFREQLARAMDAGGGIAAFPPTYKSGYERLYSFLTENVAWEPPEYGVWDPKALPEWISTVEQSGVPFCILTDHEIEGRTPASIYRTATNKPVLTYTGNAKRTSFRRTSVNGKPVKFELIEPEDIARHSVVELRVLPSNYATYIKRLFIAKGIVPAQAMIDMAVMIDDKLAGIIGYKSFDPLSGQHYLICDLSVSRRRPMR